MPKPLKKQKETSPKPCCNCSVFYECIECRSGELLCSFCHQAKPEVSPEKEKDCCTSLKQKMREEIENLPEWRKEGYNGLKHAIRSLL